MGMLTLSTTQKSAPFLSRSRCVRAIIAIVAQLIPPVARRGSKLKLRHGITNTRLVEMGIHIGECTSSPSEQHGELKPT